MYLLVEAATRRGFRPFIIAGDTGTEAESMLRALLAQGERVMDESGEWFEASAIDPSCVEARGVPIPPSAAVWGRFTNDGQRMV